MSGFLPIALQGNKVDPFALPQEYQNVLATAARTGLTQAETATEQQKPAYVQAQTVGQQITNALGQLNLGFRQWGYGLAEGGGANTDEPLPDQAGSQGGYVAPASGTGTGAPVSSSNLPPVIPRDNSQTIGMQAYNPSNLTYAGQPGVTGVIPAAGGVQIAAFPDMPSGIAATARQLMINQDQHGANTVRQMVTQWVHDPKANIDSYVADTAAALGVSPDASVNWHDPNVQAKFIYAQHPHESAGGSTTLNPADVLRGVQMAQQPPAAGGQQPYQVAQAGGGIQSPPGGNALAAAGGGGAVQPPPANALGVANPMGTSRDGMVFRGVAMPRTAVAGAYMSPDPNKALQDALQERRNTLGQLAGGATDQQSWNMAVEQAWRQGYLTNGEYVHFHSSGNWQAMRDQVIRSMAGPEAQTSFQTAAMGRGLQFGAGGEPALNPTLMAGQPPVTVKQPIQDASGNVIGTRDVQVPAPQYYGATAAGQQPIGGGTVNVVGSDGKVYQVPVGQQGQGAAAAGAGGAPAPAAPSGAPAAPAPQGAPTPAPQPAPAPTGTPAGVPAGAVGAGNVELTPQAQAQLEVQKQAQEAEQNKVRGAYGDQAASVIANAQAAPVTLERLGALENAAELFRSGAAGPQRAQLLKGLQEGLQSAGFGVPDWLNDQTTGADVINKLGSFLAANMVKSMGEKAASVFEAVKTIQPGITQSTGGYRAVLDSVRMDATRDKDLGSFQERWLAPVADGGLGHTSIAGMQDAFNKAHPIEVYASRVLPYPMPASQDKALPNVVYRLPNNSIAVWTGDHFLPATTPAARAVP